MHAGVHQEQNDGGNRGNDEDREDEEVKQRIETRVIGESLWILSGHDERLLAADRASVAEEVPGSQFPVLSKINPTPKRK
jgi:hypothetical protein